MFFFGKFLKQQTGMTTVEMVVVGGIATIAALGAASLLGGLSGSGRDAELVIEKTQFASSLGVYLNSSFGCNDMKDAIISGTAFTGGDDEIQLDKWNYRGVAIWKSDTQFSEKFKDDLYLKKLTAKLVTAPGLPSVNMTYVNSSGTEVNENLTKTMLKVRAVLEMNKREYPHEFNIPVLTTATNELRFCGDNKTMAETCSSLSGEYDPTTSACKLKDTCTIQGSFVKLTCAPLVGDPAGCDTSRGNNTVNPVTGAQSCPSPSIAISTGGENWIQNKNCGKKCTVDVNNSLGYYSCMYCPF